MKKLIFIIFALGILTFFIDSVVLAREATLPGDVRRLNTSSPKDKLELKNQRQLKLATNSAEKLSRLKAKGVAEIDRRISAMTKLIGKISEMKRISEADKTSLNSQIQNEINNLTALKAKIEADTDLVTLRANVQSIVKSYRIFALFMPKIHILAAADRINQLIADLNQIITKLETRISEAQSGGQDVSSLKSDLNDLQNKIADAKSQVAAAISEVTPLSPEGFPGNLTQLKNAHQKIKAAREDLREARKIIGEIVKELKKLNLSTPIPTLSPSLSPTVSPTPTTTLTPTPTP